MGVGVGIGVERSSSGSSSRRSSSKRRRRMRKTDCWANFVFTWLLGGVLKERRQSAWLRYGEPEPTSFRKLPLQPSAAIKDCGRGEGGQVQRHFYRRALGLRAFRACLGDPWLRAPVRPYFRLCVHRNLSICLFNCLLDIRIE